MRKSLAFIVLYPLAQLPWAIFFLWPIPAGAYAHSLAAGFVAWVVWWLPATWILIRKDRWPWWRRIIDRVNLLAQ